MKSEGDGGEFILLGFGDKERKRSPNWSLRTPVWWCAAHRATPLQGNHHLLRQKASAQREGVTTAAIKLICHFSFGNVRKIIQDLTVGVSSASDEHCLTGSFYRCWWVLVGWTGSEGVESCFRKADWAETSSKLLFNRICPLSLLPTNPCLALIQLCQWLTPLLAAAGADKGPDFIHIRLFPNVSFSAWALVLYKFLFIMDL